MTQFVDICGETLNIGDKVSLRVDQMMRVGQVIGFTKKLVRVGLDYTCNGATCEEDLAEAKMAPFNLTKLINQNVGLHDYFKYHK